MLTDKQVDVIVTAVIGRAVKMVDNRVAARGGTHNDIRKVQSTIAKKLAAGVK